MWTLLIIALSIILLYVLIILLLYTGLERGSPFLVSAPDASIEPASINPVNAFPDVSPDRPTMVTIIIPFRNEIRHLPRIVKDLEAQEWPGGNIECILVNDHSDDGSGEWVRNHVRDLPGFRYVDLPEKERGKKQALAAGIGHARGEWIIQTDADCRPGLRFIAAHMDAQLRTGADLVAGLVTTQEQNRGILELLERLDLLGLTGVASGSFARGRPLMCSGANLSYSKKLYRETRPYDPVGDVASGDDMFLMIGARKLGRKLVYTTTSEAVVRTMPASGLGELVRQRIRWGAKSSRLEMPDIQAVALLTLLTHFILLATPWLILYRPEVFGWLITGFAGKTFAELLLIHRTAGYTGQRRDLRMFIPVLLLHYPFMAVVMTGSLILKGKWKQ